jgi:F0F1-type ATP synthase membrane subunit b/b'
MREYDMRYTDTLDVYTKLREGFEEKEAKTIAIAIESAFKEADKDLLEKVATKKDLEALKAATKQDIANLRAEVREDIANLRAEVREDIANLRAEVREDIANLRAEVREEITNLRAELRGEFKEKIASLKADIIKWMFIFWIGQAGVVFGIIFTVVKFVK